MPPRPSAGPSGTALRASGKDGPQCIASSGKRWTDEAEARFLDVLAATCNVGAAAAAAGFSRDGLYKRRRRDPVFAKRWQAALELGAARLHALLLQRAIEALEGFAPDPDTPIPQMTVKDALAILALHRRELEGGPRRRQWARPRSLDEMRDSILRKLEAIAPCAKASGAGEADGRKGQTDDDREAPRVCADADGS